MANLGIISIAIFFISACHVQVGHGFNCYWCYYDIIDGQDYGDQSCGEGRVPDDQFLVNCDELRESGALPSIMSNGRNLTGILAAPSNQEETITGCVYTRGTGMASGSNYSGVYRGCFWTQAPMFENCEEKALGTWGEGEDIWSNAVFGIYALVGMSRDSMVDACMCNDEGCNTDIGSGCSSA